MKPRKVTLTLEITTDLSIGVLRKTRAVLLNDGAGGLIGGAAVQQATASVIQPIPNAKPAKKGASRK